VGLALGISACSASSTQKLPGQHAAPGPAGGAAPVPAVPMAAGPMPAPVPAVDPASVHANELGAVPVLMYHQLLARPAGAYDQTPGQFRTELEQLYAHGFRTVTAAALAAGRVDLPAGSKPMVLTFDDSTTSQYAELPDGTIAPGCAVGILLSVARTYGEHHPVASFYVNAKPFAGKDAYLRKLAALGMELGDHTATHANLRQLESVGVQRELAEGLLVITGAVPGAEVTTMALPYGEQPQDRPLAHTGSFAGTSYNFRAVLLVGANPEISPYAKGFDPEALPRIRSGRHAGDRALTATYWLPKLFRGEVQPYVSDGDPTHVSFPRALAGRLDPRFARQARPY